MEGQKSLFRVENLSLQFGDEKVFSNLKFTLKPGDHKVVVGPSGSGKTSLLQLLLGFLYPLQGDILWNEIPYNAQIVHKLRQQIAWLPQDFSIAFPSIREFIYHPFTFKANKSGLPTQNETEQMLESLGLDARILDKGMGEISGGQKQRVGLARCFLMKKPILFLDEPTNGLDGLSRTRLLHTIQSLANSTLLSVSHDPQWIEHFPNQIHL